MNESGRSVGAAARFYKLPPEQLLVVHDEGDFDLGRLQARLGGGLAGHNGLRSIAGLLGTRDFLRLRVGVGRPERGDPRDLADFVLSDFEPADDAESRRGTGRPTPWRRWRARASRRRSAGTTEPCAERPTERRRRQDRRRRAGRAPAGGKAAAAPVVGGHAPRGRARLVSRPPAPARRLAPARLGRRPARVPDRLGPPARHRVRDRRAALHRQGGARRDPRSGGHRRLRLARPRARRAGRRHGRDRPRGRRRGRAEPRALGARRPPRVRARPRRLHEHRPARVRVAGLLRPAHACPCAGPVPLHADGQRPARPRRRRRRRRRHRARARRAAAAAPAARRARLRAALARRVAQHARPVRVHARHDAERAAAHVPAAAAHPPGQRQGGAGFGTAGFLRGRYDRLYDERIRELRALARRRTLRSLLGAVASSARDGGHGRHARLPLRQRPYGPGCDRRGRVRPLPALRPPAGGALQRVGALRGHALHPGLRVVPRVRARRGRHDGGARRARSSG